MFLLQIDAEADEQLPASLIINRSVCLAKWLQSLGFGHGDYVSINSENRLEFCTVPIATFLIGATFAPLNPEYTPGKKYFVEHVDLYLQAPICPVENEIETKQTNFMNCFKAYFI